MKCTKCGSEQPDGTKFCGVCGAEITQGYQPPGQTSPAGKKGKLPIGKIAGLAAAVVVLIIIISAISGGGYKKPIDLVFKSIQTGKASHMLKAMPKFIIDDRYSDRDELDELDELFEEVQEELRDEYGKNAKVSYKITDRDKLDKDDLEDISEYFGDYFGSAGKRAKVKAGYEIELDATIRGSEDKDTNELTVTVIKIGGKWYLNPQSLYMFGLR
jgi:hypothetical protein